MSSAASFSNWSEKGNLVQNMTFLSEFFSLLKREIWAKRVEFNVVNDKV